MPRKTMGNELNKDIRNLCRLFRLPLFLISPQCVTRNKTARKMDARILGATSTRVSSPGFYAAIFCSRFIYGLAWRTKRKKEYSFLVDCLQSLIFGLLEELKVNILVFYEWKKNGKSIQAPTLDNYRYSSQFSLSVKKTTAKKKANMGVICLFKPRCKVRDRHEIY